MSTITRFTRHSLAAALALLTGLGAQAGQVATGNYNLGTDSAVGTTSVAPNSCGNGGQDVLEFTGAGANQIGLHSYSCGLGFFEFGSRSSGENNFYADGSAIVDTQINSDVFSFAISPGEIGAWGSTSFGAGEYQNAQLSIRLLIDGTTYIDDLWDLTIGAGGAPTVNVAHNGLLQATATHFNGAGYEAYSLAGDFFSISLSAGTHDIHYVMTSLARGHVVDTSVCRGVDLGVRPEAVAAAVEVVDGPGAFAAFCGAGARSGDPFNDPPIIRRHPLPEPGSLALLGLGAVLAAGIRRRSRRDA